MCSYRVGSLLSLVCILLVLGSLDMAGPVVAGSGPGAGITVAISPLDPGTQSIDVENGPGTVVFTGMVEVNKPPLGTVTVQLDGTTSTGWPTVVAPQTMVFTRSGSEEFTVTVTAPQGSPAEHIGRVTVSAIAIYPGMSMTALSTATVLVQPYYGGMATSDPAKGTDDPQTFKLVITNLGNIADTYELGIANRSSEEERGFGFEFNSSRTGEIPMGETGTMELTVSYGLKARSGRHVFYVRLTSLGAKKCDTEPYHFDSPITIEVSNPVGGGNAAYGVMGIAIISVVFLVAFLVMVKRGKVGLGRSRRIVEKTGKTDTAAPSQGQEDQQVGTAGVAKVVDRAAPSGQQEEAPPPA